jgi:hypothetical protein
MEGKASLLTSPDPTVATSTSLVSTARIPLIVTKEPTFDDEDEYEESYEDEEDEFFKLKPLDVPPPSGELQIDMTPQDQNEEFVEGDSNEFSEPDPESLVTGKADVESSSQEDLFASQSDISSPNPVADPSNSSFQWSSEDSTFADSTTSTHSATPGAASDSDLLASLPSYSQEETISTTSSSETPLPKANSEQPAQEDKFADWSSPSSAQAGSNEDFAEFPATHATPSSDDFADFGTADHVGTATANEDLSLDTNPSPDQQHSEGNSLIGEAVKPPVVDEQGTTKRDLPKSESDDPSNDSSDELALNEDLEAASDDTSTPKAPQNDTNAKHDVSSEVLLAAPSQQTLDSVATENVVDDSACGPSNEQGEDNVILAPASDDLSTLQEDEHNGQLDASPKSDMEHIKSEGIATEPSDSFASSTSPEDSDFAEFGAHQSSDANFANFDEESPQSPDESDFAVGGPSIKTTEEDGGSKDDGFADWADSGNANDNDDAFADFGDFGDSSAADGFDAFPEASAASPSVPIPSSQPVNTSATTSSVFPEKPEEVRDMVGKTLTFLNSMGLDLISSGKSLGTVSSLEEMAGELTQVKWQAKDAKRAPKPAFQGTFFESQFLAAIGKQPLPTAAPGLTAFVKRTPGRKTADNSVLAFTAAPAISAQDSASLAAALGLKPSVVAPPSVAQNISLQPSTPQAHHMATGALLSPTGLSPTGVEASSVAASLGPIDIPLAPMDLSMFGSASSQSTSTVESKVIQEDWMSAFMGPAKPKEPSQLPVDLKGEAAPKTPLFDMGPIPSSSASLTPEQSSQQSSTSTVGSSFQSRFFRSPSKGDARQASSTVIFGTSTGTSSGSSSNPPSTTPSPLSTIVHPPSMENPLVYPPSLAEVVSRSSSPALSQMGLTGSQLGTWTPVEFDEGDEIGPLVHDLMKTMPNLNYMHLTSIVAPRR